ncbi:hypothetical protein JRY29_16395 [Salmonella enterica subsp. enterica serovar Kentucky]|nr:hypothetical protein JRY29_16395 [Salmonella enterica subsp. enterica serovar Kentucky]
MLLPGRFIRFRKQQFSNGSALSDHQRTAQQIANPAFVIFIMVFVIKNPECCSQKSSNDCNRHAGDMPWLGSEQMGDLLMMIIE